MNAPEPTTAGSTDRRRRARRSGIPLYYQVMRDLKEQIVAGKLAPGQQVPSEADLTQRFGVSRVVVRQALQILDDQGLIVRAKGKGTFVSKTVAQDATPRISGSLEDLIHFGPETSIRVVEFRLVHATAGMGELFGVPEGSDLFYVERLRLVDGRPLAVLANHVPYEVGASISLSDLTIEPLIVLIETRAKLSIEWASEVFEAVAADERLASLLEVDILTPLLKLTLTVYSTDGSVVDLAEVFYRSDRYRHHGFLVRDRSNGSRFWNASEGRGEDEDASTDGQPAVDDAG